MLITNTWDRAVILNTPQGTVRIPVNKTVEYTGDITNEMKSKQKAREISIKESSVKNQTKKKGEDK